MENITAPEFWAAASVAANDHAAFVAKAKHLEAMTLAFEIAETRVVLELHRGRLSLPEGPHLRGVRFTVRGPAAEWQSVVSGDSPFAKAINIRHGQLRVEGDILSLTWATPALWELFRVTAGLNAGAAQHA
jgi:hypothetical protein